MDVGYRSSSCDLIEFYFRTSSVVYLMSFGKPVDEMYLYQKIAKSSKMIGFFVFQKMTELLG